MINIPKTAEEMKSIIEAAFKNAREDAASSAYDRAVCIKAISTANDVFMAIPVAGSAEDYFQTVYQELTTLQKSYNDPDGEYTNGKAMIGSLLGEIYLLVKIE